MALTMLAAVCNFSFGAKMYFETGMCSKNTSVSSVICGQCIKTGGEVWTRAARH